MVGAQAMDASTVTPSNTVKRRDIVSTPGLIEAKSDS
jgi:hypothetical protein